jgi:hypothetical protein
MIRFKARLSYSKGVRNMPVSRRKKLKKNNAKKKIGPRRRPRRPTRLVL